MQINPQRKKPTKQHAAKNLRKPDRVLTEKRRRTQQRKLYSVLASLLPSASSKEKLPLPALLDQALVYVKQLKEKVHKLMARKQQLEGNAREAFVQPSVEINETGSYLEVNILNGLNKTFMLSQALKILAQEGAEVLGVNLSTTNGRIHCTIRSQAFCSRIGIGTSNVHERLKSMLASGAEFLPIHR